MNRTTAPGSVAGQYVDDDPPNEIQGTLLIADDRNAIQEEILNVIEAAGITPSAGTLTQLRDAVRNASNLDAGTVADARLPATAARTQIVSGACPNADIYRFARIDSDNLMTSELLRIRVSDNNATASTRKTATLLFSTGYDADSQVGYILGADLSTDANLNPNSIYRDNAGYFLVFNNAFTGRTMTVEKLGQTLADDLELVTPVIEATAGGTRTKTIPTDGVDLNWRTASLLTVGNLPLSAYLNTDILTKVKEVDGTGSGLDADLFDGLDSGLFIFGGSNSGSTFSDDLDSIEKSGFYRIGTTATGSPFSGAIGALIHLSGLQSEMGTAAVQIASRYSAAAYWIRRRNTTWSAWEKLWTAGNDGSGSGMDTDLVRGTTPGAGGLAALAKSGTIWAADNDGAGSGLDADLLDGTEGSGYAFIPQTASGRGQWIVFNPGASAALQLPANGTWAYFAVRYDGSGIIDDIRAGVAAGSATIVSGQASRTWRGFTWRIA